LDADFDVAARSNFSASSAIDRQAATLSELPISTASEATAIASMPLSRKLAIDSAPLRFDSPSPLVVVSRLWCPKPGGSAPSAFISAIWTPVLVTWSSPRITWLTASSISSTTEGSV
jgi:hypothetical protein